MTRRTGYVRIQADALQPGDVIRGWAPNVVSGAVVVDRRGIVRVSLQSPKGYHFGSTRFYRYDSIVVRERGSE